jgi:hypothetical protein
MIRENIILAMNFYVALNMTKVMLRQNRKEIGNLQYYHACVHPRGSVVTTV